MSELTSILTGRMHLKRNTSYLLDLAAVASSLSLTRQPQQTIRLEIEVVGCTVAANGRVTVYSTGGSGSASYIVQDRTLATKWAIQISDGVINITASVGTASSEPIVEDNLTSGIHWKIYVDNGVIGWEASATVQDDDVLLNDTVTSTTYQLVVSDGILGIASTSVNSEVFTFSENLSKIGSVDFSAIDGITMSGISDGFIKIKAINKLGQPVNQLVTVQSNVPVRFYKQNGRIKLVKSGDELVAQYKIMAEPDLDLRENDLVFPLSDVVGLTLGQVDFVERIWDFDGITHHTEAVLVDL